MSWTPTRRDQGVWSLVANKKLETKPKNVVPLKEKYNKMVSQPPDFMIIPI